MSIPEPSFERVWPLIEAACLDTISDRQMQELQDSLRGDAELQRVYLEYCRMHAELRYLGRAHATNNAVLEKIASGTEADSLHRDGYEEAPRQAALPSSPVLGFLGDAYQGTAAYFSEHHVVFSYLVAVACFAVAALVGSLVNVSHNYNLITSRSATAPDFAPTREELVFVGRITGMKDCRWADPQTEAYAGASVPLNRRYALSSGLMEITYHSGAKVILEGPCTYKVESPAGGYLLLGKLTAKVEKRGEGRGTRDEGNSYYPLSPIPSPLFFVRTPTAIVTDLGTEFGVEVSEGGDVTTHVFEGAVELEVLGDARRQGEIIRIGVGELVRLEKGADGRGPTVLRGVADAAVFAVRPGQLAEIVEHRQLKFFRRWKAFSESLRKRPDLVAYYDFQQDEKNNFKLRNRTSTGRRLDGWINGASWVSGRFPGKHALYFRGRGHDDRVVLPEQERFQFAGPFSIAVWFKVDRFEGKWLALAAKGDTSWRLQQHGDTNALSFGLNLDFGPDRQTTTTTAGRTEVADGRWHFAVAVYEPGDDATHARLYLDGRLEAESRSPQPVYLHQNDEPVWLGDNSMKLEPSREFQGLIDEAAFIAAPLSADEVAAMFEAGAPDHPLEDGERR